MKYRLLLTNTAGGKEREILVSDHLPLEDLSPLIKIEFQLPYSDNGWHRFLACGAAYVIEEHLVSEPEIRYECNLYVGRYRCSERTRLKDVFAVLGSAVTYSQDDSGCNSYKIRITLLERI